MSGPDIVLASRSSARRALLENAGVTFQAIASDVDEDVIKDAYAARNLSLEETAMALARAKAEAVSHTSAGAFVIGADQILGLDGRGYDKPLSMEEAAIRLREFSGKTHYLHTAVCVVRDGDVVWSDQVTPALTMRLLDEQEIATYLSRAGADVLVSVGAYQLEGVGAQLFNRIDGDYFSILGLPLLPLLSFLRDQGALDF